MTDVSQVPQFDGRVIREFLLPTQMGNRESFWELCLQSVSSAFHPDHWIVDYDENTFKENAHANLYNVEAGSVFKTWLQTKGVSIDDYAKYVGEVQFVSVQAQLRSLAERAMGNKGWRVRLMGFPALGLVVAGLGTHYQGTQNHNLMGQASARLRQRALEVLTGEEKDLMWKYPAATSDHWDDRGLMTSPITHIGGLDISGFEEGQGARLRMVRNTTVKKELSTFFAITGLVSSEFEEQAESLVTQLHAIAAALGRRAEA